MSGERGGIKPSGCDVLKGLFLSEAFIFMKGQVVGCFLLLKTYSRPRNIFIFVISKVVNFVCIGMERKKILYKFCVSQCMNKNISDTTYSYI